MAGYWGAVNGIVLSKAMVFDRKKTEEEDKQVYLTTAEAQEYLRVCKQTLYKLIREGLVSYKIGKKRVFIMADVNRWLDERESIGFTR